MKDEQCQALWESLQSLGDIIVESTDRIVSSIDNIYCPYTSMSGIEKLLEKLIDAIDDAAGRI